MQNNNSCDMKEDQKLNSDRGNRTPGCRVRDGDVSHYTISDWYDSAYVGLVYYTSGLAFILVGILALLITSIHHALGWTSSVGFDSGV
ncbi:hypothetical protein N7481_006120 [Penicillium waksmanii]|uniref:uncharacterized protein n=1 Tax=Penicillium waksmanii TaxID=69791 RepID=UPI002547EB16|nr:uncharacterized protein N7481_006120 [Penicillium waksmanii]KAJ5984021.1 hypothetical protein N7481_006120 [Penicillium waksmanii]